MAAPDLERFRSEWQAELQARRTANAPTGPGSSSSLSPTTSIAPLPTSSQAAAAGPSTLRSPAVSAVPLPSSPPRPASPPPLPRAPIDIYRSAVEAEQSGQLSDALALYRHAFRLDNNVDKAYARVIAAEEQVSPRAGKTVDLLREDRREGGFEFKTTIQTSPDYDLAATSKLDPLGPLLQSFASLTLGFEQEEDIRPCPIANVPDEVLVYILRLLGREGDLQTLERWGGSGRKMRILSSDPILWKQLVLSHYIPPHQLAPTISPHSLAAHHGSSWRRVWIERPRIRMDGVYIAICHYMRHGQAESLWTSVVHLITFHRFLRFLPDGRVLSLLTTQTPAEVVPILQEGLRMKGMVHGRWELRGDRVRIWGLRDPGLAERGEPLKYQFRMDAQLKSSTRGRHNKINLDSYLSLNMATGEELPLALKHQRPFYFSKVLSWPSTGPPPQQKHGLYD